MDFFILGALEARAGADRVPVGGARYQTVLATLLLEAGRVVSLARLTEAVYGEAVPATGRTQVQICVSALRRLFAGYGLPDAIDTRPPGYVLDLPDDSIDVRRYEQAVLAARQARDAGRLGEAAEGYRAALGLWRGPVLEGIDSRVVRAAADRLAEHGAAALEECIDLELRLGRHRALIGELTGAVDEHPLRERLRGQLMVALYRSGRRADALAVFRRGRRLLVEELGLEPGEHLRDLERRMLAGDAELEYRSLTGAFAAARPGTPVTPAVVPRLLPTDIADFTGRAEQVDLIERELAAGPGGRTAVPVVALSGAPGIGKTTLAVHAAHRLAPRYPDGQLYADLHGPTVDTHQVLERFLRALGVPGNAMPDGLDERAERYRDLLAGRRLLIVLDNAATEDQVRPLVPGSPQSGVLVTSRLRLAALPGATHLDLRVFDPEQSAALLSRIAGAQRVQAERATAAELAELCGQLPLAIRIAGARLAARPHWSLRRLVDRLTDEARRLDELAHAGLGVRAGMALAYEQLGDAARRLFRLLAGPDFADFPAWVAAALLDGSIDAAQDLLDELTDAQLLQVTGAPPRFRFHDLLRVYARERLAAEERPADREAALGRAFGALLDLSIRAVDNSGVTPLVKPAAMPTYVVRGLQPDEVLGDAPISWLEVERDNIAAAVRQSADAGLTRHCWMLVEYARVLYELRGYHADWRAGSTVAMAAAVRAGDEPGRARTLFVEGTLLASEERYEACAHVLTAAAALFADLGEAANSAQTHLHISQAEELLGQLASSEERRRRALVTLRQAGATARTAWGLALLANTLLLKGDVIGAHVLLSEALELSRQSGARRIEAQVVHRLGQAYQQEGRWDEAIETLRRGYTIADEIDDPAGKSFTAQGVGVACLRAGRFAEAQEALGDALRLAKGCGQRLSEARVLLALGELAAAQHDDQTARDHLHQALAMFREMRAVLYQSQALALLGALTDNGAMGGR